MPIKDESKKHLHETPKLVAVPSLLVYGADSRSNYLTKTKTSRRRSSGSLYSTVD